MKRFFNVKFVCGFLFGFYTSIIVVATIIIVVATIIEVDSDVFNVKYVLKVMIDLIISSISGILIFLAGLFYERNKTTKRKKEIRKKLIIKLKGESESNMRMLLGSDKFGYLRGVGLNLQVGGLESVLNKLELFKRNFVKDCSELYSKIVEMNHKWLQEIDSQGLERYGFQGEYSGVKKFIERKYGDLTDKIDKQKY